MEVKSIDELLLDSLDEALKECVEEDDRMGFIVGLRAKHIIHLENELIYD